MQQYQGLMVSFYQIVSYIYKFYFSNTDDFLFDAAIPKIIGIKLFYINIVFIFSGRFWWTIGVQQPPYWSSIMGYQLRRRKS